MSAIDDGGSAFPVAGLSGLPNDNFISPTEGMRIRDWFAVQALPSIPHIYHDVILTSAGAAKLAYKIADEMLAARKEGCYD